MIYKLNDKNFIVKDNIPEASGVYYIVAIDENDDPIEIYRLLESDQSGTLYIGKANNLRKRLINMQRAFSLAHKSEKHIAVRRYNSIRRVKQKFPIERIGIMIKLTKDNQTAKEMETETLARYERIMGERPPLNRQ